MEVKRKEYVEELFKPIVLEITLKTKEEAQAMYAMFNYSPNDELIGEEEAEKVKNAIGYEFYIFGNDDVIANGVTYEKFYAMKKGQK